jgi:hypothetical protein
MVRNVGLVKIADSKKLRERASYFRRLAIGAGDPQFTGKLGALAEEYEAMAVEADAQATSHQAGTVGDRR